MGSLPAVHIVLVSSPGAGPSVHWSHAFAVDLGVALVRAGAAVVWFASERPGQTLPAPPVGVERIRLSPLPHLPPHRAAADNAAVLLEEALARSLRGRPADAVVHVGLGARGSPNVCWLAERMGSRPFAVARAAEVVCHRGDLREGDGSPCREPLQPERCRRCCSTSWWRRPQADELPNRADLLVGSLLVTEATFVLGGDDAELLPRFGANRQALVFASDTGAIATHVLAALR